MVASCMHSHAYFLRSSMRENNNTFTGIFQFSSSRVEAKTLFRPHIIISCPIGFPTSSSNRVFPRAFAVSSTGPIPSPPPISKTAGNSGSIWNSSLKSSYKIEKVTLRIRTTCILMIQYET